MELINLVMDVFRTTVITIPFMQLFLLIATSTVLLLFGSLKFALLANYMFTFYWGFRVNFGEIDIVGVNHSPLFSLIYLGFGSMIVMLVLFSFRYTARQ